MIDLGNGVISWPEMDMEWQKVASDTKRNREDSDLYCSRLNLGGHSDWVMPGWRAYRLICTRSVGCSPFTSPPNTYLPPAAPTLRDHKRASRSSRIIAKVSTSLLATMG